MWSNLRIVLCPPTPATVGEGASSGAEPLGCGSEAAPVAGVGAFLAPPSPGESPQVPSSSSSSSSGFCCALDSAVSYTHDPYSFGGVARLPSPRLASVSPTTEFTGDPPACSCAASLLHGSTGVAAHHRHHVSENSSSSCQTSDSTTSYTHNPYGSDGMVHLPSPPLPFVGPADPAFSSGPPGGVSATALPHTGAVAQRCPLLAASAPLPAPGPPRQPSPPTPSTEHDVDDVAHRLQPATVVFHATAGHPLPGPPAHPSCSHPKPWQRLRGKRGLTTFVCRDCGTRWRVVGPGRSSAPEAPGAR
eukprot:EG_transcript_4399